MKIRLNTLFNAPDDYKVGDCAICPLHSISEIDYLYYTQKQIRCRLGFEPINCPVEIESEE